MTPAGLTLFGERVGRIAERVQSRGHLTQLRLRVPAGGQLGVADVQRHPGADLIADVRGDGGAGHGVTGRLGRARNHAGQLEVLVQQRHELPEVAGQRRPRGVEERGPQRLEARRLRRAQLAVDRPSGLLRAADERLVVNGRRRIGGDWRRRRRGTAGLLGSPGRALHPPVPLVARLGRVDLRRGQRRGVARRCARRWRLAALVVDGRWPRGGLRLGDTVGRGGARGGRGAGGRRFRRRRPARLQFRFERLELLVGGFVLGKGLADVTFATFSREFRVACEGVQVAFARLLEGLRSGVGVARHQHLAVCSPGSRGRDGRLSSVEVGRHQEGKKDGSGRWQRQAPGPPHHAPRRGSNRARRPARIVAPRRLLTNASGGSR